LLRRQKDGEDSQDLLPRRIAQLTRPLLFCEGPGDFIWAFSIVPSSAAVSAALARR